jgi:hypothetical protein
LTGVVRESRDGYMFVHLNWKYEELAVTLFDVSRSIDNSGFQSIANVAYQTGKTTYNHTDGPLSKGPVYKYCVQAVSGSTRSPCANLTV